MSQKRALLSVYDKAGIVDLARALHELGIGLVSSQGTCRTIREASIPVTDVTEITGVPPILSHRVATLHPKIHGGILAVMSDRQHRQEMVEYDVGRIDYVVGNLYPFASSPSVDQIDIGGPALLRAGAKNFERVTVLVDPADYEGVLEEIRASGETTLETRKRLARKAFDHTAAYDVAIVRWFDSQLLA